MSWLTGSCLLSSQNRKSNPFLYMHLYIVLFPYACINTKRRIRDTQSFQEIFRDKPHLTTTNVQKELQNICDTKQELKFKLTLLSHRKLHDCVYQNDILIKGKSKK